MKFSAKEFIASVLRSDLSEEAKTSLLENVMVKGIITEGFYLKAGEDGLLECWYRNVDNETGTVDRGPTGWTPEQAIEEYKRVNKIGMNV